MDKWMRLAVVCAAAALVAYLWASLPPESLREGLGGITADPQFALTVRLTGFIVLLGVALYFAVKNIRGK